MASVRKANVYRRAIQKRKHHDCELALIIGDGRTKCQHAAMVDRQRQKRHAHAIHRRPDKRTGPFLLNKRGDTLIAKTNQRKQTRAGFAGDTNGGRLNNYFKRNVSECERLGIPYDVHLYSYACIEDDAKAEARLMLSALKGHSPSLPVYYDLEEQKNKCCRFARVDTV